MTTINNQLNINSSSGIQNNYQVYLDNINLNELVSIFQKNLKNEEEFNKIEVKNMEVIFPRFRSNIELNAVQGSNYAFSTYFTVKFEGDFGSNPDVYLLYSKDDSPIKLDDREDVEIISLVNGESDEKSYEYSLSREYSYSSINEIILKEYVLVIISKENPQNIGFVVVLVADKQDASVKSSNPFALSMSLNFNSLGSQPNFQKVFYKGSWPRFSNLLGTYTYNDKKLKMKEENIDAIIEMKDKILK